METGLSPGRTVGHYVVAEKIGEGGMGVVYRARDSHLGRTVALKALAADLAVGPQRERLLREAQAVASLSHPAIATIYDIDSAEGVEFIAMEFVAGRTLADLVPRGGLHASEALKYAVQIADALAAAHAAGIVHRDIKPGNVMVSAEGRVKVLDFGIAKFTEPVTGTDAETRRASWLASPPLTSKGTVVGTSVYMSPEQARGLTLDPRSDVFSFGIVLHQMLTGQHPFQRPTVADTLGAILHDAPPPLPPLDGLTPDTESELQRLVQRCLEKRAEDRCQSGAEVLAALRGLRRRLESATFPPTPGAAHASTRWRHWRAPLFVAGAAACAAWMAWTFGPWAGARRGAGGPTPVVGQLLERPHQLTSTPGPEAEAAISPDGSLVAYVSDEGGSPDIWLAGVGSNPLRLTDHPAAEGAPAWFPDGAALAFVSERGGKASIWRVPVLGGSQTLLVADALDPAIDPAGTRIAFVRTGSSGSTRVAVTPLRDLTRVTVLTHDDDGLWNHRAPTWSPDGRFIAYAAQRGLWVVPADGGDSRVLTSDGEADEEPAWSPDGRYVYFRSAREGTEAIWRVAPNGGRPERVTLGTGPEGHPSLSRDGRRLAYTTFQANADLMLRDLATGRETTVSSGREHSFPTFSPDGRRIAFVSNRLGGVFRLVEQPISEGSSAGPARAITDHPSAYPAYSPDGVWLAYYRLGGGRDRHVWIVPSGGGEPVQFTDGPTQELHPAWSPRGSEIAFVSDTGGSSEVWVRPVAEGRPSGPARRLASSGVGYEAPAWSPDGTQLAVASQAVDRAAAVWLLRADGSGRPRLVASLGTRVRVRWDPQRPALFVSAFDEGWVTLRRVPLPGESGAPSDPLRLGPREDKVDFDVSRDGRWLVFARGRAPTGDVWVAEINDGGGGGPRPAPSRTP